MSGSPYRRGASLVLFGSSGAPVASGVAGSDGAFALRAPHAGVYRLSANRPGYEGRTVPVDLRAETSVSLLLRLQTRPVELAPLTVLSARVNARLRDEGFYDRMKIGFGHFVTPGMIARRNPLYMADLLKGMAGVHVDGASVVLAVADLQLYGRRYPPAILVDGILRTDGLAGASVHDVAATEVYPYAGGTPVRAGGMNGTGGVILIWTKRSQADRPQLCSGRIRASGVSG